MVQHAQCSCGRELPLSFRPTSPRVASSPATTPPADDSVDVGTTAAVDGGLRASSRVGADHSSISYVDLVPAAANSLPGPPPQHTEAAGPSPRAAARAVAASDAVLGYGSESEPYTGSGDG